MAWIYGQFFPITNSLWWIAYDTIQQILGWGRSFRPDLVLFVTFFCGGHGLGILGILRRLKKKCMYMYKLSDCIRVDTDQQCLSLDPN